MPTHAVRTFPRARGPASRPLAIEATDLVKTYGSGDKAVTALAGISLAVPAGTVFGLLGPNGAGKSTTVKILTTLSAADSGTAVVAGLDVGREAAGVRRVIGYVSQRPGFDPVVPAGRTSCSRVGSTACAAGRRSAERTSCSSGSASPMRPAARPGSGPAACSASWTSRWG
jgi:ABC-2 type transport system ATP-binding protein